MRLGITKRRDYSKNEADTVNLAGGTAFSVDHPSIRLLSIVGNPFFNEPRAYYSVPENPDLARKFSGSLKGLIGQAKMIVEAALDVARSDSPRDLLAIAHWLRLEGHCRQTPLVLLAVAASEESTKSLVRGYVPRIVRRADELAGIYGAYRYIFGKPIPSALMKGIKDAFGNFDEYQLIKYNQPDKVPSLKDVLLQVPNRKPGVPVSRGMAEFILNGTLIDRKGVDHSESAPIAAAYVEFLAKAKEVGKFTDELKELADKARATWETIISLFGNNADTWNSVIPRMGYMALLRNVRNIANAGADIDLVASALSNEKLVLRSKQYPFRFLSAIDSLGPNTNIAGRKKLLDAISTALDISVKNVGEISGDSIVLVDCSGSMNVTAGKSTITMRRAAAALAAILAKACESAYVFAFATETKLLPIRKTDSVETIISKIDSSCVGFGTYAYKPLEFAVKNGLTASRIVLLSDMQCYHDRAQNLQDYLDRYRKVVNRDVWFHSVNMNAQDFTSQVATDKNVNLMSGFSDKSLNLMLQAESGEDGFPALDYIRANF